jgi:hypothetical protein
MHLHLSWHVSQVCSNISTLSGRDGLIQAEESTQEAMFALTHSAWIKLRMQFFTASFLCRQCTSTVAQKRYIIDKEE